MAEKRMFSIKIIDSDAFLDMPLSTQALYFHLSMRADDDGFLNSARKIMRTIGAAQNDYDLLVAKKFIIQFPDGICVIKHWRINNYLRSDRYKETLHTDEKSMLEVKSNGAYTLNGNGTPPGIPQVNQCVTQYSIDKNSIDKVSKEEYIDASYTNVPEETAAPKKKKTETKHKYGEYQHVLLKDTELEKLNNEYGEQRTQLAIKYLDEYIEMKGSKYKSHYLVMRKWVYEAVDRNYKGGNRNDVRGTAKPTAGQWDMFDESQFEGITPVNLC